MTAISRRLLGAAVALALMALALVAGCGGSPPTVMTPPPGAVVIAAQNEAFVPRTITAPAGEAFVIYLDNRETALHNVRVVDGAGATIVSGELFSGPSGRSTNVPALVAGTYRLLCDIHPAMTGELIAN